MISENEIFPWSENFVTGIQIIDEQHQKLVALLNKLAGHMAFGSDAQLLTDAFYELTNYSIYHFRTEEKVWTEFLPGEQMTSAHTQSHQDFVINVHKLHQRVSVLHSAQAVEELVLFLTHWLAFHILEEDTHMARIVLDLQKGGSLTVAKENAASYMKGLAQVLIQAVLSMYDKLAGRTLALMREVSDRLRTEEKLRLASNIIESSTDATFITDEHGIISDVNPAFCQDMKCSHEALLGQSIYVVKDDLFASELGKEAWAAATSSGHWVGEIRLRGPSGALESIWLSLSMVRDEIQRTVHYVGILSSISQLVQRHQALELAANHDPLTGLPNRRLLDDRLVQAIERSKRNSTALAICFLDLDGFKLINDSMGHDAGDAVLCTVADRMSAVLRGADTVARIGGDEFVLLLSDLTRQDEVELLIERVRKDVSKPIDIGGDQIRVGASIGATLYPGDAGTADELIKHADLALYKAKAQGKGCYRWYVSAPAAAAAGGDL